MKEKSFSIRISQELYDSYVKKTLAKTQKEKRLIKMSEVIREVLEKNK